MPGKAVQLAHLAEVVDQASSAPAIVTTLVVVAAVAALISLDHRVKGLGGSSPRGRRRLALVAIGVLIAAGAPNAIGTAQGEVPAGLPDLISDPPFIWFNKLIHDESGQVRRVMAFDGYIHNIGDGPLEMFGNPQEPGGVRQRVWNGDEWEVLDDPPPLVLFETTDGHEHFHLMAAAEYELWDVTKTVKIGDSSKVGFCLVDTEQREERYEAFYSITTYRYCEQYHPESTELRMGITPGWTDTYDANTTLQWVDISEVRPGYYWVGAITDPDGQVVESDEDNNDLVFSQNRFAAPGYVATQLDRQDAGTKITLSASAYGRVGQVRYRIDAGPENGSISVPVGVDLTSPTVLYTPDPGFDGIDTFTYSARDADSAFPLNPVAVTVEVDAAAGVPAPQPEAGEPVAITVEAIEGQRFESIETAAVADGGADLRWYAAGLPSGLTIDEETGLVSGVLTEFGSGTARIVAVANGAESQADLAWDVDEGHLPEFNSINDFASPAEERIQSYLGLGADGATYSAEGLPEGSRIGERLPLLAGRPSEVGTFDVVITETVDGQATRTAEFRWTVLPLAVPRFPL